MRRQFFLLHPLKDTGIIGTTSLTGLSWKEENFHPVANGNITDLFVL